jgi:hypothetical protein
MHVGLDSRGKNIVDIVFGQRLGQNSDGLCMVAGLERLFGLCYALKMKLSE